MNTRKKMKKCEWCERIKPFNRRWFAPDGPNKPAFCPECTAAVDSAKERVNKGYSGN